MVSRDGSVGKESTCNAGDASWIPGLERSPGGGHGNPLQYPCLENPMDRGAWWATVRGPQSRTGLSGGACTHGHVLGDCCGRADHRTA